MHNALLIMTLAAMLTACQSKHDDKQTAGAAKPKSSPRGELGGGAAAPDIDEHEPRLRPQVIAPPPRQTSGPIIGTAEGTIEYTGESKRIDLKPRKTETLNPCNIVKVQGRSEFGTQPYLSIAFEDEVERISFKFEDPGLVSTLEPYVAAIHDRGYSGGKQPLKVAVQAKKSTLWIKSVNLTPAANELDCDLEFAPSPVVYRAIWKDDQGKERVSDSTNKGARISVSCKNQDSDASKVRSVDVTGHCWILTQTLTYRD